MHKWRKGYTPRFWQEDYKNFEYIVQPVTYEETEVWKAQGYDYVKSFTGKMYDNRNPMPSWVSKFNDLFPDYKNLTFTFYKMSTLEIMPEHADHYRTYCKLYDAKYEDVVRILVMLEDWKPGHYLEINGVAHVNWVAGEYFVWNSGCPHAAANIGVEDRYTLQITATKIKSNEVWNSLHWYNIPKLKTKEESNKALFLQCNILSKMPDDLPTYLYMINGRIKELEDIKHHTDVVEYLNTKGLHFYLYEPLCSYELNKTFSMTFYSEFAGDIRDINHMRAAELDSIFDYANKNNLTNVTVHTCDYQADVWYPYYKSRLQIITDDLFLKTTNPVKVLDNKPSPTFNKRFICLNWRYTPHRQIIAAFMAESNSTYLSWYFKSDMRTVAVNQWLSLYDWYRSKTETFNRICRGFDILNKSAPINIDLDLKNAGAITTTSTNTNPNNQTFYEFYGKDNSLDVEQYYRDIFCDIVTESRFAQPTANYSEKTYRPMFYKKPFILVAPPKTLAFLKEQGFQTFEDFWDESYDNSYDHERRLLKIIDLIYELENKPMEELREMYIKMLPILEHNYNLVNKILS